MPDAPAPQPLSSSLSKRWRATTVPFFLLRASGQAAEFAGWIVLARRLGTSGFGELSVAFLLCRYGGLVADFGVSVRGVRDVAGGHGGAHIRSLVRVRTRVTALLAITYCALVAATGHVEFVPLVTVLMALGLNRDWLALGRERGGRAALPSAVQGLALFAGALAFPLDRPAAAPAFAYLAALVLSLVLNRLPADDGGHVQIDAWMLAALIANQVLSTADTLLLAWLVSASDAGIYAAVYRIPNAWLALLSILRWGLLPVATSVVSEGPERAAALRTATMRWSARAGVALAVLAVPTALLVPVVFGSAFSSGRLPLVILMLSTAVITASAPLHDLMLALGGDRPYARYLIGAASLNLLLNFALIPAAEMNGAAFATLAANCVLALLLWVAVDRRMAAGAASA